MNQWVVGEGGADKILCMFDAFKKKAAGKHFSYHPALSNNEKLGLAPKHLKPGNVPAIIDIHELAELPEKIRNSTIPILALPHESNDIKILHNESALLACWHEIVCEGWFLIMRTNSWFSRLAKQIICEIIPIVASGMDQGSISVSSRNMIGSLFIAPPPTSKKTSKRVSMALSIAHELAHQVICLYERCDDLVIASDDAVAYSGTRKTARPIRMVLHAAAALRYMAEMADLLSKSPYLTTEETAQAHQFRNYYYSETSKTIEGLVNSNLVEFTSVGESIVDSLSIVPVFSYKRRLI